MSEIARVLGVAPSTASRHVNILVGAGLVEVKREGKWRFYRLPHLVGPGAARRALGWVLAALRPMLAALLCVGLAAAAGGGEIPETLLTGCKAETLRAEAPDDAEAR
jgi:DNA-binding transcriptional ArsR family regulator